MGKERKDYHFENGKLTLVPLDLSEQYSRVEWLNKNKDKRNWEETAVSGVSFIDFVGYGANGIVLKAKEEITERTCAVKIWLPNARSKHYSVYFKKFQEEIKKISHLKNNSIVTVYNTGITEKEYCYSIMEWVEGLTLKKLLENNKDLKKDVRFKILNDILLTVNEFHRIGVLHGDLHCENILIEQSNLGFYGNDYKVKILDFGTSLLNRDTSEKYNKQRESALLLETALKLLSEEEKYGLLNFKYYSSLNPKKYSIECDDVRNVEPLIVSSTLKNICALYELVEKNHFNHMVYIDMLDIILTSTHLDVQAILKYIIEKNNESDELESGLLINILSYKTTEYLFETSIDNYELRTFELTLCYFELLKSDANLSGINYNDRFKKCDIEWFDFREFLNLESIEDILEYIKIVKQKLNEDDYIDFLNELFEILGEKFKKEYESNNELKRDLDLVFKLNELRIISFPLKEIINWNYR